LWHGHLGRGAPHYFNASLISILPSVAPNNRRVNERSADLLDKVSGFYWGIFSEPRTQEIRSALPC
jgi:hypothetical protein